MLVLHKVYDSNLSSKIDIIVNKVVKNLKIHLHEQLLKVEYI